MPKNLTELKESALAWALVFIVSSFAATLAYNNNRIATLYDRNAALSGEFVRLERYQADRATTRDSLRRIENNISKLLMIMAAKEGEQSRPRLTPR